jgi:hypothetical protein
MRRFEVEIPVVVDKDGLTEVDEIVLALTNEDVEDLNNGLSITTLTTQGEEVALFPEDAWRETS